MSDKSTDLVPKHIKISQHTLTILQKEADKMAAGNLSHLVRLILDKHCAKLAKK